MAKIYQVFVGCPFTREIRRNYDKLKKDLEAETPLSLVLADTAGITSSDYLLEHITELIRDSAGCIFDTTGNNPNVSLEVGIAHTIPVDFLLTLKTRRARGSGATSGREGEIRSIISDLQGKNRIEYKTYPSLHDKVVARYLDGLPYMRRWKQFQAEHKSMVSHVVKFFVDLRSSGRSTQPRLESILEGSGFSTSDVTKALIKTKLVTVRRGRAGGYYYPM